MRSSADTARDGGAAVDPVDAAPRCQSCGNGRLARDRIKTALWSGSRLVVVEDVPALVCGHCGEQFYEDETAMRLDMLKGGGFPSAEATREMVVAVFAFEAPRPDDGGGGDER
ncbi:type II toxin-antitoxin system MqsA family antitoxin [Defluviimonas sp. WL0024]|uniref:Type II toxin-antitoxin system MqsA family antitoxin n=1 Tax=Albidovulum salinarum TaxID=2984153 RepID=A0ABT2X8N5_9RHOB|nr:type II toxin-antitoxin system MqsA family antitoxin [Defluviimonas sp. WL0024]MCU9849995.1 type II toxin-antitoxin system MqsA family antitoxin [Defluviimonas sp. WL0024]